MNNSAKYFFYRCQELLHRKTFDSYRVGLHNPYSIFKEFDKSIEKFNKKRIKHFNPTISSIGEEAKYFLTNSHIDDIFSFGYLSKKQILDIINNTCEKNIDGKKTRTLSLICKTICYENNEFKLKLLKFLNDLLIEDNDNNFDKIDTYLSWLVSQLLFEGFSRTFISDRFKKSHKAISNGFEIQESFDILKDYFSKSAEEYEIIFKVKKNTEDTVKLTSSQITEIENFPEEFNSNTYINDKFKTKAENESYFGVKLLSLDFFSALNKAYVVISETLEINTLHHSDNNISLESQALLIHTESRKIRMQTISDKIDGFYNYQESEFVRFSDNYKKIRDKSEVAHEKIRSAIRFYKFGNDSIEIEHKILNYWIGFEQLFSSIDSNEDSITRMKIFFTSMNSVYFWQRRVNYLLSSLKRHHVDITVAELIASESDLTDFQNILLNTRYNFYKSNLNNPKFIKSSIEEHIKKMNQHLTRIYRVRNELVHEGRSFIDLFLIAGHLRHYLIFSIEQITNKLAESPNLEQLDDVFVYFENLITRIKNAQNIQEIFSIKSFNGYME